MPTRRRTHGGCGKVKKTLFLLTLPFFLSLPVRMFSQPDAPKSDAPISRHRLSNIGVVPEDFSTLKLAPGFLLNMDVYDTPELSGDFRIDTKGDITVPTVGHIHVGGETLPDAATQIEDRLRSGKILNEPQINLNIAQYAAQNVTVLGEVHEPGRLELLAPHTLVDILALAGGETQYAGNAIEIQRSNGSKSEHIVIPYFRDRAGEVGVRTLVLPGDIVTIPRAGVVYVLGAVNRAGGFLMQDDGELDVTQALSLADGTQLQAAVGSMRLIRKLTDGKVEEMPIPYSDIVHGKAASPRLQADDVIYVPMSKFKIILGAALLQSAANAAIYVR
jgi:polysaccharide export outer membrane protein